VSIPDYQSLMRPLLEVAYDGEIKVSAAVDELAKRLRLSDEERSELLPSGRQTTFSNRVHWAKNYLSQAGLLLSTRYGYFKITDRGREALKTDITINNQYLERFPEFLEFRSRGQSEKNATEPESGFRHSQNDQTPDETLRSAYRSINDSLAAELLAKIRGASSAFFEELIVQLLLAMGYGGTAEKAGRTLGRSGDGGVDGVIDQDALGVDQVYIQAKLYKEANKISSGDIRDFFGALNLKRAQKGIFVTASRFTPSAIETAEQLGSRIVLVDGEMLARLMIRYCVGCRIEEKIEIKKIDDDFFES